MTRRALHNSEFAIIETHPSRGFDRMHDSRTRYADDAIGGGLIVSDVSVPLPL
jgi:hypothetical protein